MILVGNDYIIKWISTDGELEKLPPALYNALAGRATNFFGGDQGAINQRIATAQDLVNNLNSQISQLSTTLTNLTAAQAPAINP